MNVHFKNRNQLEASSKNRYEITETIEVILKTSHSFPCVGFLVSLNNKYRNIFLVLSQF